MVAKDFRRNAWSLLAGKWGLMIVISLISWLISGAVGGVSFTGRSNTVFTAIASVISLAVGALVNGPLNLGTSACYLKLVRRQNFEIVNMFDGFKNFVNSFLLYLLNGLLIVLWSCLLIIPGIIASYAYGMSTYILADNPAMDANAARKRSVSMMDGNKWRLFCLDLSFIGWYLLSMLTFGILLLWVVPYHSTARALFYEDLLAQQDGHYTQHDNGTFGEELSKDVPTDDVPPINADDL